MSNLGRIISFS